MGHARLRGCRGWDLYNLSIVHKYLLLGYLSSLVRCIEKAMLTSVKRVCALTALPWPVRQIWFCVVTEPYFATHDLKASSLI
jgi:hypothetical protein